MSSTPVGPAIAVHGGAFDIPAAERAAHREGCLAAARAGWAVVAGGGSAVDAVETAVRVLEDSGVFGAGRGAALNEEGVVELDAGFMDGRRLDVGSVAAVRGVANPIALARRVMESPLAVYVGPGARQFAERMGVPLCDPAELVSARERAAWEERRRNPDPDWVRTMFGRDTVGAVALDVTGDLAAGTSTGGMPHKPAGRVGDSPWIGAGLYADNGSGAVSTTGHGERIIPVVMAKAAADLMGGGLAPQDAAEGALARLLRVDGRGGLIALDRAGRIGVAWNTPSMAFAIRPAGAADFRAGP
jgi:L-asparaginase / beta-aspartyl-peptidase